MKFIKPSVEIIDELDVFKRIEIAARTCYKSESKISDDSAEKMVKALIKRGHESPLEHSWLDVLISSNDDMDKFSFLLDNYEAETHIASHIEREYRGWIPDPIHPGTYRGNYRAWRSLVKYDKDHWGFLTSSFIRHPWFEDIYQDEKYNTFKSIGCGIVDANDRDSIITARFICDRGVSHELVRHRVLSFSQESTRYVNYQEGLVLVEPWWWPEQETSDTQFVRASCQAAEDAYCSLIASGASPQKARCVLPNMLKTEVVATGTVEQWQKLVLPLRLSKAAHPDIRRLMELFCEQLGWDPNDFRK